MGGCPCGDEDGDKHPGPSNMAGNATGKCDDCVAVTVGLSSFTTNHGACSDGTADIQSQAIPTGWALLGGFVGGEVMVSFQSVLKTDSFLQV